MKGLGLLQARTSKSYSAAIQRGIVSPFPNLQIPLAPVRIPVPATTTAAMEEEATPIREIAAAKGSVVCLGLKGSLQLFTVEDATLTLVITDIGLTNAASSLTVVLSYVSPRYILSCGSAGGLDIEATIGEVTASSDCVYGRADAREFGYELGQILGMSASYVTDEDLLGRFTALPAQLGHTTAWADRFLSSGCSVSAELIVEFRKLSPNAITTDMEPMALTQVAAGVEVPFLAIYGISDLYGPEAAVDNYQRAPEASRLSFLVTLYLIGLREPEETA